ncbi:MAG: tRNA preQ1(34) S-adenosylmethionine ribosyltransferase-isomerase QueA [Gemmatimonadaceae bacterium]
MPGATGSRTRDYDFHLPDDRIAQAPAARRDESRLMIVHRESGEILHGTFRDVASLIQPGDTLALNTTRVIRARLIGTRDSGAPAEVLLLKSLGAGRYEAMVNPGSKLKPGRHVHVGPELKVEIIELTDRGTRIVHLRSPLPVEAAIEQYGHVPLPPYIRRPDDAQDSTRYQTVYAAESGSVAAPTAGLHFTNELLMKLHEKNVERADLVLHVGAGTFKPIDLEDPAGHVMHEESFAVSAAAAATLNATHARGGSIWAVGTTSVRTLESAVQPDGTFSERSGDTRIFIRPPYSFRATDRLITNFHLPRSTLLMLVAAFAGYELTMRAYRVAIREGYRFYSYGDAMVVL